MFEGNDLKNCDFGDSEVANAWVDKSALDEESKKYLIGWMNRFQEAPFYRYLNQAFEDWKGPEWLKSIWSTLAFVWPEKFVQMKLGSKCEDQNVWVQLYLGKCLYDTGLWGIEQELLEKGLKVFVIGEDVEEPGAILLVDFTTQIVYRLQTEEISFYERKKWPIQDALQVYYDNYFLMLEDICAIRELTEQGETKILWEEDAS